jgi:hypothetical protein
MQQFFLFYLSHGDCQLRRFSKKRSLPSGPSKPLVMELVYLMVIAYWSINSYCIRYVIYTFALCKETNCSKFISVYQHFQVVICITTTALNTIMKRYTIHTHGFSLQSCHKSCQMSNRKMSAYLKYVWILVYCVKNSFPDIRYIHTSDIRLGVCNKRNR